MSLISAIIALGFLIFIHELGHFLLAKRAGVAVSTFSLGFGPRLLGFVKNGTDYRISAIPLGGYVRMVGEHPGDEIAPEDIPHSFSHKPVGWRLAIVSAGPLSNIILAFVMYLAVLLFWGIPSLTTLVGDVVPGQPAALAGLQKGDRITAINGVPLRDWGDMVVAIQKSEGQALQMVIDRGGSEKTVSLAPRQVEISDVFGDKQLIYRVGIKSGGETMTLHVGPLEALEWALRKTYVAGELIFVSVVKLMQRKVSVDNLGGPILIAQAASQAAQHGLAPLLDLTALISVNLAVLNLLPIPALDGGHIFFFLIEAIRRRPVSAATREKAQQVGMVLLLMLMAFIFYNDIARLVTGGTQ